MERRRVWVSYHQFTLAPPGVSPILDGSLGGPLVTVGDEGTTAIVATGIADGRIWLTIEGLTGPPPTGPEEPVGGWDVVDEVSMLVADALVLGNPVMPAELDGPGFTPRPAGWHRLRASARGRAAAYDLSVQDADEEHLVQIWPESAPRERISRDGDGLFGEA